MKTQDKLRKESDKSYLKLLKSLSIKQGILLEDYCMKKHKFILSCI